MTSIIKVNNLQNQCGANIINENAGTITIGASGDTVTLAAGASQSGFGVDWDTTPKTTNFNAEAGKGYFVDTTSNVVIITLPTGVAGKSVTILDYVSNANTNAIIINPQAGEKIEGGTTGQGVTANRQALTLTYSGATQGWLVSSEGDSGPIGGSTITFTTASGSLGSLSGSTEREDPNAYLSVITASTTFGTLNYSIQSGSLPLGLTINSTTGAFVGTATAVDTSTESTFTVRATLTETGQTEDRSFSITLNPDAAYVVATGGTIVTSGDYKIHLFTGPGTFTVTDAGNPVGSDTVTAAVVAGGGGAGSFYGGGGGGGGLVVDSDGFTVSATSYPIAIGAGGNGPTADANPGLPGSNSTALGYVAIGGGHGGGGGSGGGAEAGGSGGGGGGNVGGTTTGTQPSQSNPGATNYGNPGGPGPQGSGGGGAGGAGSNGPGGAGGAGFDVSPVVGPSGSIPNSGVYSAGGRGQFSGAIGAANTGNGGGGDNYGPQPGNGRGGSGIVIIKYKFQN